MKTTPSNRNATHVLPARAALIKNRWDHQYVERRKVIVMAVAEGYAMVRKRGGEPYVAPLKEIEFQPARNPEKE